MSCYQQLNAELAMSDKTNDKELSLDELKAVSGAGFGPTDDPVEVASAKTTPSTWDADKCQNQMAQAKCARKIQSKGQAWKNDKNV